MNSFTLSVVFESRELPGGVRDILITDAELLIPPRWADEIQISSVDTSIPDALLLVISGPLSPKLRNIYYNCFRHAVPIAGICFMNLPEDDDAVQDLLNKAICWKFSSANEGRELLRNEIQSWLRSLNREFFPYPEGNDLLQSYGDIDVLSVDMDSLEKARKVITERGFVCLSGSLGAGKTTIARKLLVEASLDNLNPIELITRDLYFREVVQLLTGSEDCAVFLDLDTLRRMVDIYPSRLWASVISLMTRATESRHRLILATSSPEIARIFDSYGDAHVRLPEPSTYRKWRLDQGREALKWFRRLPALEKAELLLLAAFDPVVAEAVFKRVLFRLLDRLIVQEDKRFPSNEELEELYSKSLAAGGADPFRRVYGSDEVYITVSDSVRMWAIDRGIRELLEKDAPVIRAFADTLIGSEEPGVRRAGYFLASFYKSLSDEVKAKLLLHIASEKSRTVLTDVLNMLLSSADHTDESIISMYRIMMAKGNTEVRMAVAGTLGRQWVLELPAFGDLVNAAVNDSEPGVRGQFIQDLTMWGMSEKCGKIYRDFLEDDAYEVRQGLMLYIGSKFPGLDPREFDVLNEVLEEGDPGLMTTLIMGLLDRKLEEFNQEFNDLLWVLMDRLPPGGKGRLAWRIGARLRFFSSEVRKSLRTDPAEEDILQVSRCMLMNYSSLDHEERENLWELIHERIAFSREFASMVLGYYTIMDPRIRINLLIEVLISDHYGGREALSQLICLGRTDLIDASVDLVAHILETGEFKKRAALPFFILWNERDLGEPVSGFIAEFWMDSSSYVRKSLVNAIRSLGIRTNLTFNVLCTLALDDKRAVRAAVARTLGEFENDESDDLDLTLKELLDDEDPYVRLGALSGLLSNVAISDVKLLPVVMSAFDDSASDVRLEIISGLRSHPELYSISDVDVKLADMFTDPDRNVRMEVIRLVTETPELLASDIIRTRMPDILLNRFSAGHAISEELNMARKIQLDLLPDSPPSLEGYDIEIFYRPASEVGGDYYDFFHLPDRNLGLAVADVAGKGIPAALTMAGLKGNLVAYVQSIYSISEIIQKVNESSVLGEGDPIMTGLFYGVLDLDSGKLTYVNAGHNPPLLVKREGESQWLEKGGLIMGLSAQAEYEHGTVKLESGDVLILYTDGLTEAMDSANFEFGTERLCDVVLENRDLSAHQISSGILDAVNSYSKGLPQGDDQTLVVLKYR
ncbi:MAG: SpoIIE family protein phosphatase [Candidatus Aegiribacteria sp.]|nr:SpoIIE family protein phosphatase [Candidatus Aegiribacteria sp.]